jgi:hypothetical protein
VDVWAYVEERRRECREVSVAEDPREPLVMAAEAGTDGQRGRLLGHVHLADDAYVQIHETVVVEGDNIHREKYAYFLSIAGKEIGGYERDPTHDPSEHRHCSARAHHERLPAGPISFKDAITEAWEYVSRGA